MLQGQVSSLLLTAVSTAVINFQDNSKNLVLLALTRALDEKYAVTIVGDTSNDMDEAAVMERYSWDFVQENKVDPGINSKRPRIIMVFPKPGQSLATSAAILKNQARV